MGLVPAAQGRLRGVVTTVQPGYVFALVDAGAAGSLSVFIHRFACQRTGSFDFTDLREGSRVELTIIDHPRGLRGIEVRIITL
jgi:cold shock CspA family protein